MVAVGSVAAACASAGGRQELRAGCWAAGRPVWPSVGVQNRASCRVLSECAVVVETPPGREGRRTRNALDEKPRLRPIPRCSTWSCSGATQSGRGQHELACRPPTPIPAPRRPWPAWGWRCDRRLGGCPSSTLPGVGGDGVCGTHVTPTHEARPPMSCWWPL